MTLLMFICYLNFDYCRQGIWPRTGACA